MAGVAWFDFARRVLFATGREVADAALASFTRQMKKLPAFLRESLTCDRGSEMARHEDLAKRLNIDIWFADPYAPWKRGSNENTNGLLRQYLPKGVDLSGVSQTVLADIARLLNGRPRKTLGWKTPEQALVERDRTIPSARYTWFLSLSSHVGNQSQRTVHRSESFWPAR